MHNFGKNVVYEPRHRYTPRTEEEILAILERHRGGQIRVQGAGHSWSGIVVATDVLVSLANFSDVTVEEGPAGHVARVGAGATIEKILVSLRKTVFSLPTLGAITRQTIAGATATATHGTGNASLSSFVRTVRLACYDDCGDPIIRTIRGGDELLAARASLGCLGIILELTLELVPRFWMHEVMKVHDSLESVLAEEAEWPQQQFLVFPYGWQWYAYHRRRVPEPNARNAPALALVPGVRRARGRVGDALACEDSAGSGQALRRQRRHGVLEADAATADAIDAGQRQQRDDIHAAHAPSPHLPACRDGVVRSEEAPSGRSGVPSGGDSVLRGLEHWREPERLVGELARVGLLDEFKPLRGQYVHHYLIFFRRVLGEETYLAMNEGGERYSISLFTFEPERRRRTYYAVCGFLARAFARLYSARPHWGKYNPLTAAEIAPLYPGLERFREICIAHDPNGVFQNAYTKVVATGKSIPVR